MKLNGGENAFRGLWKDREYKYRIQRRLNIVNQKVGLNLSQHLLIKENYQEYICGEYQEGRYAWILDNVKPLKTPIKAKGQLSIWNYEIDA